MSLPFIFGFFSCCRVLLGWLWMKRVRARVRACVAHTHNHIISLMMHMTCCVISFVLLIEI